MLVMMFSDKQKVGSVDRASKKYECSNLWSEPQHRVPTHHYVLHDHRALYPSLGPQSIRQRKNNTDYLI